MDRFFNPPSTQVSKILTGERRCGTLAAAGTSTRHLSGYDLNAHAITGSSPQSGAYPTPPIQTAADIQPVPGPSGSGGRDAIVSLCRWYKISVRPTAQPAHSETSFCRTYNCPHLEPRVTAPHQAAWCATCLEVFKEPERKEGRALPSAALPGISAPSIIERQNLTPP